MKKATYSWYLMTAMIVTCFSLLVVFILWLCGANNYTLVVGLNMVVLAFAATCTVEERRLHHIIFSSSIMVVSIIAGGFIGFYLPIMAPWLVIIYGVLAFLLPKTLYYRIGFGLSALMFLVYSAIGFDWQTGWPFLPTAVLVIIVLTLFFWLLRGSGKNKKIQFITIPLKERQMSAMTVGIALVLGWIIEMYLKQYTHIGHLYWLGLTVLIVVQAAQQKYIRTSLLRILANIVGALVIILLMSYVIPQVFWVNCVVLVVFLFLMFALSFSYVLRVIFIEMFVLTFMHLADLYKNALAYDRIYLTLIGSGLVVLSFFISYLILRPKRQN
jgi:hypothetical protein